MTKKVISLLMALMLTFSMISISVYAADDEGIEPRGPVTRCDNCQYTISLSPPPETWIEKKTVNKACPKVGASHEHVLSYRVSGYRCPGCGITAIEMSRVLVTDTCSIGRV